jgi:UDP-N-acetylmuramyl pentapeptide phosphotransferase/UDP-N-acetylglucosamine-1-phosphate transferase
VRLRLGVSLAAGALVWALAGVRVTALGLPLLDDLLVAVPAFSLVFTLVAVGGLVHAMNIVDGLNGLLAGKTLVVLGTVALVAARFNEPVLVLLAVAGMAATAGFAVFNFPHGRMFCGDAGAYLIGYLSAILVVLLVLRQDTLSPWFALAVVIHPVTETLYSVWRRASNGLSATHPDARHMHSLWSARLRTLERATGQRVWLGSNAGAAWRTLAVAAVPSLLATCWSTHTLALQVLCVAYVAAFIVVVRLLEQPDTEAPTPVTAASAE